MVFKNTNIMMGFNGLATFYNAFKFKMGCIVYEIIAVHS